MALISGEASRLMEEFLESAGGCGVIDGGLATELERHGADLNDPLWSAKCLITSPHLISQVHQEYLKAGAEILITASYQATIQGFESKGLSQIEAEALLRKSVEIACEARDQFWQKYAEHSDATLEYAQVPKCRPILVAASVGSYGAYLADGSEYTGDYGPTITVQSLKEFHRRRVQVLAESGADLLAFETVPNKLETQVTAKPVLIYPNSGETYDAERKEWVMSTAVCDDDFVSYVQKWKKTGASLIGGCCRTTPNTIKAISRALNKKPIPDMGLLRTPNEQ